MTTIKVLWIDDEADQNDALFRLLLDLGIDIVSVTSGERGLERAATHQYDVIALDLHLQDMCGLSVLQRIRRADVNSAVVIVTGCYREPEMAQWVRTLGARAIIYKPVLDEVNLAAIVRQAASNVRNSREASPWYQGSGENDYFAGGEAITDSSASAELPTTYHYPRADGITRWASAVAGVVRSEHDPKTLAEWSRLRATAPETIRGWCRTSRLSAKGSLDLARVLRAVFKGRTRGGAPRQFLDVADRRTLERLVSNAGMRVTDEVPTLSELLARQTFIRDPIVLEELRIALASVGLPMDD